MASLPDRLACPFNVFYLFLLYHFPFRPSPGSPAVEGGHHQPPIPDGLNFWIFDSKKLSLHVRKNIIMQQFLTDHHLEGLAIGLATFLIIGIFHPLVIKGEYYMGQKCNILFIIAGVAAVVLSILSAGVVSILLGVTAFSCFWSVLEVREQRERVRKGWFPENPARKKHK